MADEFDPRELVRRYQKLQLHSANEATTRLQLIDEIVFKLLGWSVDEVQVEERCSQDGQITYVDYIIRTGMTAFVIEAKRAGADFELPATKRREQLRGRLMRGAIGDAITQARDYAYHMGIPFAAATNGSQWIIFPAQRTDQTPTEDWHAIIFPSIESIAGDDIEEFRDLLQRDAVISGSLEQEFWGRIEDQIDVRRISNYYSYHFSRKRRNYIYPFIEDAILTSFTEDVVKNDAELLEKCYVKTPDRIRFDKKIRLYIERPRVDLHSAPIRPIRGRRARGIEEVLQGASVRARPVSMLVLGTVGAGKTTFLDYTRNVSAANYFQIDSSKAYPHWIQLDMRQMSPDENPTDFIFTRCLDYMNKDEFLSSYERCIKFAYKDEIDALLKGPMYLLADDEAEKKKRITDLVLGEYKRVSPYAEKILSYAASNTPIFLVVDNVDQFEDPQFQERIFSISVSLSRRLGLNLILAMRDATFTQHRTDPSFDAFDYDPIYIDPPNISSVLSRRFFLAIELLSGKTAEFETDKGAKFQVSDLSTFMETLRGSVLGTEVGRMIEIMASFDVRLALRMTREFLQHGYTAPEKALKIKNYVLPRHEALRAIMLGNDSVYQDSTSVVGNPFDAHLSKTSAQLLRLFILYGIVRRSTEAKAEYVEGSEIREVLRELGFADTITLEVLRALTERRLIHTRSHADVTLDASFISTRLGGYIVRDLISNFTFLENILVDTFIADGDVWSQIKGITDEIYNERDMLKKFQIRKTRVVMFFEYMKSSYSMLRDMAVNKGVGPEWCGHPLEELDSTFRSNLSRATRSAERTAQN